MHVPKYGHPGKNGSSDGEFGYPDVTLDAHGPPPEPAGPPSWTTTRLPALLFALTCLSTLDLGGPVYALALMTILLAHELGHYLQARRYGVPTSLPFFLPMPALLSPFGTLGAVLAMRPGSAQAKGLFDIAITGPLAGLVPSLVATAWGLRLSEVQPMTETAEGATLGAPLLFQWLADVLVEVPADHALVLHPLAYAGWVGFFVTALNLMPVGQLDGGHILFSLAPKRAHLVSRGVIVAAFLWMAWERYWLWTVMLLLLLLIGLRHPPVRPGGEPIGLGRRCLGWGTLALAVVIFTPKPFQI